MDIQENFILLNMQTWGKGAVIVTKTKHLNRTNKVNLRVSGKYRIQINCSDSTALSNKEHLTYS